MNINRKPKPMHWNCPEPTNELSMVMPTRRHRFSLAHGQNVILVYAVKSLSDKAFNLSWSSETFCYTWHTLRPRGGQIREEKGLR